MSQIMEKLCLKFISDGVKLKLINEIAMDYGLQLCYWGCDNKPKQHLLQVGLLSIHFSELWNYTKSFYLVLFYEKL